MNKINLILFICISAFFIACNRDDENTEDIQLTPNFQNMTGKWYIESYIKEDGTTQPYNYRCDAVRDYAEIPAGNQISTFIHYSNCVPAVETCDNYFFEGNRIKNCLEVFNNAKVVSLTATTMKIEYDTPRTFGPIIDEGAKSLILNK